MAGTQDIPRTTAGKGKEKGKGERSGARVCLCTRRERTDREGRGERSGEASELVDRVQDEERKISLRLRGGEGRAGGRGGEKSPGGRWEGAHAQTGSAATPRAMPEQQGDAANLCFDRKPSLFPSSLAPASYSPLPSDASSRRLETSSKSSLDYIIIMACTGDSYDEFSSRFFLPTLRCGYIHGFLNAEDMPDAVPTVVHVVFFKEDDFHAQCHRTFSLSSAEATSPRPPISEIIFEGIIRRRHIDITLQHTCAIIRWQISMSR
ncbi:hypothetical protein KM043_009655 [Ampulex compressa]|nr:hypothetical protein KM043_009655 [Ampulex compressa]